MYLRDARVPIAPQEPQGDRNAVEQSEGSAIELAPLLEQEEKELCLLFGPERGDAFPSAAAFPFGTAEEAPLDPVVYEVRGWIEPMSFRSADESLFGEPH